MAEARRRAADLSGPTWFVARMQTAAHGRRGRAWVNPAGNFAGTLVLRPSEPPDVVALRSFVAALALHDAFVNLTGRSSGFALKWPNDVLLNGAKLAGILLESHGQGGRTDMLAIGIGVNLVEAPATSGLEEGAVAPTSLSEAGVFLSPEEFLPNLATAYALWESRFATFGFAPIREAWLARAARLGEVITARTGRDSHSGSFETVDEQGNLVLKTAQGRRAIPAADIYF
ncbi:MAG: biotin--[acetyl-CoA-carboxylase] ligase [Litoreibacter sp.]|nr:biotin--[acetyl-CoA-carboxylase] ligase [Litoreibacter sp.]